MRRRGRPFNTVTRQNKIVVTKQCANRMLLTSHGNCEGISSRSRALCVSLPKISYLASKNCKCGIYFMFVGQITPADDRHRFYWRVASSVHATCWPMGPSSHYVRLANDECRWLLFSLLFFPRRARPWSSSEHGAVGRVLYFRTQNRLFAHNLMTIRCCFLPIHLENGENVWLMPIKLVHLFEHIVTSVWTSIFFALSSLVIFWVDMRRRRKIIDIFQ